MSTSSPPSYQSYLLRLWRSSPNGSWRGSLHNTATGEKQVFADLPALVAFLVGQLGEDEAALLLADLAARATPSGNQPAIGNDQSTDDLQPNKRESDNHEPGVN